MKKNILFLFLIACGLYGYGQQGFPGYYRQLDYTTKADSLYNIKSYEASAAWYTKAIGVQVERGIQVPLANLHYGAACSWALAQQADSAFYHLEKSLAAGFNLAEHLLGDADLQSLHTDPRWRSISEGVTRNLQRDLDRAKKYTERTVFTADPGEIIFSPPDEYIRQFLFNDTLPFASFNHENFRIYLRADSYTAGRLPELKQELSEAMTRINQVLGINAYSKGVNLLFTDSKDEMKELTGFAVGGGLALPGQHLVFINSNKGTRRLQARHEIFHIVSNEVWGMCPSRLLNEGGAVYTDNVCFYDNPVDVINAYMLKHKKTVPLKTLINDFDNLAKKSEITAYMQSAGVFKYLYEHYGVARMKQLWVQGFEQFESIYGISLEQFEKEWLAFVKKTVVPPGIDWDRLTDEGCG